MANWGASKGGFVGGAALIGGSALNAGAEAIGANFLAAAGDKIGSGDIAGGATDLAVFGGGMAIGGAAIGKVVSSASGTVLGREVSSFFGSGARQLSNEAIVQAVGDAGATFRPHATRGGQGVAIQFPDGLKADIRVETHPLTQGGSPQLHGNVQVWRPDGTTTNQHILP